MKVEGHIYKPNAAVLCGIDEDVFEVLIISSIYSIKEDIIFKVTTYKLEPYDKHYRAHILSTADKVKYISYNALIHYIPLHPRITRILPQHTIIILPFYISH